MGYKVDFDALDSFDTTLSNQINNWGTELESIAKALDTIKTTKNMSGEGSDNIKTYFDSVHGMIQGLLGQLLSAHQKNCFLYKRDYFSNIDKATHVVIKENELEDILSDVTNKKNRAVAVDDALADIMFGIRDIYYLSYKDVGDVYYAHQGIEKFISDLNTDIKNLENRHYQNDFNKTGELIRTLTAFINECQSKGRSYKKNFDIYDLAGSESFQKLYAAYVEVDKEQQSKMELIETEIENQKERVEILEEERAERERKAKVFKWVVTGVCIVGAIVITAATGGAGAPLIAGAVSAGSAVVSTTLHGMADEYVEHGYDRSEYDWGKIAKDAAVAGVTGFATGAIGAGIGGGITDKLSSSVLGNNLLHSSNSLVRIGTSAVIGSASEVGSGIVSRTAAATIAVTIGGADAKEEFAKVLDGKSILTDAAIGGAGGAVDNIVTNKRAQNAADDFAADFNGKHDPVGDAEAAGIEKIKRTQNNGADFSETDEILKFKDGEIAEVKIKSTGNRNSDYKQAEKILKEQGYDIDFESMRKGKQATHVWHHLDDYNAATNETTMQFITKKAHNVTKPHTGSAAQYYVVNGKGYGKDAYNVDYSLDITGKISTTEEGISGTVDSIDSQAQSYYNSYYSAIPQSGVNVSKSDLDEFFKQFDFDVTLNGGQVSGKGV
ncbi:MAG: HNH endonuclease [Clostridia bacterium]|nr:HNH endonuclease [Clostridia bacterium]